MAPMTQSPVPSHAPQGTIAHAIVQAHLDSWLDDRNRSGRPVPKYVEDEFRDYLSCGDPEGGFTRLACPTGHYSRYVAAHCKGRGFCARCLTRRQRKLGRHLVDRVIGNVPVRHAVLCFPPQLRYILGYDEALLTGGFASLAKAVFQHQRRKAAELFQVHPDRIHPAGIAFNHRVSANLDTNHHFHGVFPDGVFVETADDVVEFRRLPAPTEEDIADTAYEAGLAFCAVLKARGFWETTSKASPVIEGTLKLPKREARTAKFFGQAARDAEGGVAPRGGAYAFHLFVSNAIEAEQRPQLEQLINYILAPPFRDRSLQVTPEGKLVLQLKRSRHDGTTHVLFTPYEFLDRLADLVPRPKANTVRYYGIYAPRARLRKAAITLHLDQLPRIAPDNAGLMTCPICSAKLSVVIAHRSRRGTGATTPPDTPCAGTPRGQDRIGRNSSHEEQRRLF